jgi:hypothetical protein
MPIVRRYGKRVETVEPDFRAEAMTEVGFRRTGERKWALDEFLDEYAMVRGVDLTAEGTDAVQEKAEKAMLQSLADKLAGITDALKPNELLSVESELGKDYPRTRYERSTKGDQEFTYSLDRPLRVGIFRKRD